LRTIYTFEPPRGFGPVTLGQDREAVRAAMSAAGFPLEHSSDAMDYFCDSSIQVECGEKNQAHFIGVSYSPKFTAMYRGVEVFAIAAPELFALIEEADGSGPHQYESSEYRFPGQIMTLWDADPQYDRLTNESKSVWGQVGIGNADYLAAIAKIEGGV